MVRAIHDHLESRLPDSEFHEIADDAVRLAVEAQLQAEVDVVTDGEQRRDSYASFVGGLLDGCQLIPITDLLPYVDDPAKFEAELRALDVPAADVRHPAVFGPIRRHQPLALRELEFAQSITDRPIKIALPGPYLLMRTMWMDCITDRVYATREQLADDVVRVLREELNELVEAGAALVQLDEPVLTEVVFGQPASKRSFMCGALSERLSVNEELRFAEQLINRVVQGVPPERIALHICRGNWTPDESVALAGSYEPLVPMLRNLQVGTFFLELCTPRAGEIGVLASLPDDRRIGVGVVNQKRRDIESVDEIVAKATEAINLFGADRVLLNPDCGFATFADNPVSSGQVASKKLAAIAAAARLLRAEYL
jgi:5-methyltetrahydropteroyltriglutamate--homocysteine methyltransferase